MKFRMLVNTDIAKINENFIFKSPKSGTFLLINVKMPTINELMSRINFMLAELRMKRSFIISGPGLDLVKKLFSCSTQLSMIFILLMSDWRSG